MRDLDLYCRLLTVYKVRVMIRVMNAEVQMRDSVVALYLANCEKAIAK